VDPAARTLGCPPGIGGVTTAVEGSRLPVRTRDAVGGQTGEIVVGAQRRVGCDRWSYHYLRLLVVGDLSPAG
jgi:hypothetical protein